MIKAGVFGWPVIGRMMQRGRPDPGPPRDERCRPARSAMPSRALERGEAIIIYPGRARPRRIRTNWPMQARTGIARLVLLSPDSPVVPVGQWGPHRMGQAEPGAPRQAPHGAGVGRRAARPEPMARRGGDRPRRLRAITDEIMSAVRDSGCRAARRSPAPTEFFVPTRKYIDKT